MIISTMNNIIKDTRNLETIFKNLKRIRMIKKNNQKILKFVTKTTTTQNIFSMLTLKLKINDSWNENKKKTDNEIKRLLNNYQEIEIICENETIFRIFINLFYQNSYEQNDVIRILKDIVKLYKFEITMKKEVIKTAKRYIIDRFVHRVCVYAELRAVYYISQKIN